MSLDAALRCPRFSSAGRFNSHRATVAIFPTRLLTKEEAENEDEIMDSVVEVESSMHQEGTEDSEEEELDGVEDEEGEEEEVDGVDDQDIEEETAHIDDYEITIDDDAKTDTDDDGESQSSAMPAVEAITADSTIGEAAAFLVSEFSHGDSCGVKEQVNRSCSTDVPPFDCLLSVP